MERRKFLTLSGVAFAPAIAGCSGNGSDPGSDSESEERETEDTPTPTPTPTTTGDPKQSLSHEIGESFTVGEGAQSVKYSVSGYSTIEDYVGSSPSIGSEPDGTFVVVTLTLENVGDETIDITTRHLKLADQQDRTFEADTEALIYADQDPRIEADPIAFDQLQPGLSVTRSVIYDVPSGTYRLSVEPVGVFSGADTHYVPLGDV